MKKFALLIIFLLPLVSLSQELNYKPRILLVVEAENEIIKTNFRTMFETDAFLAGYRVNGNLESNYILRALVTKRRNEMLVTSVLLKRKPTECDPNAVDFVILYASSKSDEFDLAVQTFKYLNEQVWKPETSRLEQILNH